MTHFVPIAIACNQDCPDKMPITGVFENYPQAVAAAGGLPVIIPETEDEKALDSYLDMAGGLLIPGGIDVDPLLYGRSPDEHLGTLDPALDHFQLALVRRAHKRGMPVFGICRGIQVIAVAFGGTLIQHLPNDPGVIGHHQKMHGRWPSHMVRAEKDSLIEQLFGAEFPVNSFHHQAVENPPQGFRVTAKAPDGVIEAIESENLPWTMAVQWHPEFLVKDFPAQMKLVKKFIEVSAEYFNHNNKAQEQNNY
jgi:putative glutamine amidotransferase